MIKENITDEISIVEIDENLLFNTILNLRDYSYDYDSIINTENFIKKIDENNIKFFLKLYKPIFTNKDFKDIIEYNQEKKNFVFKNTIENKKKLRNLLAASIINNIWPNLNFLKDIKKFNIFRHNKNRAHLFLSDYFYLYLRKFIRVNMDNKNMDYNNKLSFSMDKIMNYKEINNNKFMLKISFNFLTLFLIGYSFYAIFDSISDYYL